MKVISFSLNPADIRRAISELQEYKAWVKNRAEELIKRLAAEGFEIAKEGFDEATVDEGQHTPETECSLVSEGNGYTIYAIGDEVMFIEFGAGVYYNGAGSHPEKPAGLAGIGEYGHHLGKLQSWHYERNGEKHTTHGTPAQMPMYKAKAAMRNRFIELAREVFSE